MINKHTVKGYILGALSMLVVSSSVFAAPVQKSITAAYNNIKIYVDGVLIQPKDASGKTVEPFVSDGTTYLPVRAVGEAFGKDVKWDGATNSVYIGNLPEQKTEEPEQKTEEIVVSTAEEFVKAIGSNKKIILKPGNYNITKVANKVDNPNIIWDSVSDGFQLTINSVNNLTIQGDGDKPVDIVAEPRYAQIFHITGCKNINFKNIKAGHTIIPDEYDCNAGVLYFENSQKISICDSILYGCGSMGITTNNVVGLNMENSVIEKCNLRIMQLSKSNDLTFNNCKFRNCKHQNMFEFYYLENIVFNACEVSDNTSNNDPLIVCDSSKDVKFLNTKFKNNTASEFCRSVIDTKGSTVIDTKGSTFEGNSFD